MKYEINQPMPPKELSNRIQACFAEIEECERKLEYLSKSVKDCEIVHGFYELPMINRGITFRLPKSKTAAVVRNVPVLFALLILECTITDMQTELDAISEDHPQLFTL